MRFLSCAFAFLLLAACSKPPAEDAAEPDRAHPVQTAEVRRGPIERTITAEGVLRAIDQSSVTPKISAPVKQFYVNRGDHVRAGQLLATLESSDLAAAVADAKGVYDQAQADYRTVSGATVTEEVGKAQDDVNAARQSLDAAQKLLDSRQDLFRQGALARRLVDEAAVAKQQAQSQYDIARRHLESYSTISRQEAVNSSAGQRASAKGKYDAALAQLSFSEIKSPIAGVISDRPAFAGEMAQAGTPLLTVMNISRVIARVNVPLAQAKYLKVGQAGKIVATDGSGEVGGKVTVVSPAVDPQSTTVEVWVEAENPQERLRPGGTVRVNIDAGAVPDAILVPASALYPSIEGGSGIILVEGGKAKLQKVEVGIRNGEWTQILSDLKPGAVVVTEGGLGLEDDAKVTVEKPGEAKDEGKAQGKEDDEKK
jgi:multidrug efflux pump subunit AcrA (membrane-fusion protein)